MSRPKGSQNKITLEVKDKLQLLIDDLIASLDVNELDANQRIKMMRIILQYTLPKMKQATNKVGEDLPLFLTRLSYSNKVIKPIFVACLYKHYEKITATIISSHPC